MCILSVLVVNEMLCIIFINCWVWWVGYLCDGLNIKFYFFENEIYLSLKKIFEKCFLDLYVKSMVSIII